VTDARVGENARVPAYTVNEDAVRHAKRLIDARRYVLRWRWQDVQPRAREQNALAARPPRRGDRNPDCAWVTQQVRNLAIEERLRNVRFLIHDRDAKFCGPFDAIVRSEGVRVIETPFRAPRANPGAEPWVRTVRSECLDHLLIVGRRHLDHVTVAMRRLAARLDHSAMVDPRHVTEAPCAAKPKVRPGR
jgi:hypothetical protein